MTMTFDTAPPMSPIARRVSDDASAWFAGTHLFTYLVHSDETEGAFALIEIDGRRGGEPPDHTHTREDETYYVLEGEARFRVDDRTIDAPAGTCVFLPRGHQHGFELVTERVRMLLLITPGGFDAAFKDLSAPAERLERPPAPTGPPPQALLDAMVGRMAADGVVWDLP